jgi:multidrug resistance efflux pump
VKRKLFFVILLMGVVTVAARSVLLRTGPKPLVLTGIVTTDDVIVGPQIAGRVDRLLVGVGDTVARGQLIAVIAPEALRADQTYYEHSARAVAARIQAGVDDLSAAVAQRQELAATLDHAIENLEHSRALLAGGGVSQMDVDQARTDSTVAQARLETADRQVAAKRSVLAVTRQEESAAAAQASKAGLVLGYTEVVAPIAGIVDVRAALEGEVVTVGQPIVTLVDPDDFWVRADVEESWINRVRLGDSIDVRLPWD